MKCCRIILLLFFYYSSTATAQKVILDSSMHHLRNGKEAEWENFSRLPVRAKLVINFPGNRNEADQTLSLKQNDVKQFWRLILNNRIVDSLVVDENHMKTFFRIPPGYLLQGNNELKIEPASEINDDIEVGRIVLDERPLQEVLTESRLDIEVRDSKSGQLTPARITIVDAEGRLQTIGTKSKDQLAVRPGIVYTGNGKASLQLSAGAYKLYATRGFEYSVDSFQLTIQKGERVNKRFTVKKEVQTNGWVSCDTHIHTLTHSGHGDASDRERALTIAGEEIELAVNTEHNLIFDLSPVTSQLKLQSYFTSVPGDEVTTPVGHFNYFPLSKSDSIPNYKTKDWDGVSKSINLASNKVAILNHGRDIHNGFRPFDAVRHVAIAGLNLDNWRLPANAMEVVNSGALLNDGMRLFLDWFGMLNRGIRLTPVGASDSHDVGRYLVGQARTYIQARDDHPGNININEAISNFRKGNVMVSFGLLPEIKVNKKFGPGDLVTPADEINIEVKVSGPSWINADSVTLFANGIKIHASGIKNKSAAGVKWNGNWNLKKQRQDVFLVAIAEGQQRNLPFWPIVKPYQPTSTSWSPYAIGCTGAVWIDADSDGKFTSAHEYANKLVVQFSNRMDSLIIQLNTYDEAVAIQAAAILYESGIDFRHPNFRAALKMASNSTEGGINKFIEGLKLSGK